MGSGAVDTIGRPVEAGQVSIISEACKPEGVQAKVGPGAKLYRAVPTVSNVDFVSASGGARGHKITPAKVTLTVAANPEFYADAKLVSVKNNLVTIQVDARSEAPPRPNLARDRIVDCSIDVGILHGAIRVKIVKTKADGKPGAQLGSVYRFQGHLPA